MIKCVIAYLLFLCIEVSPREEAIIIAKKTTQLDCDNYKPIECCNNTLFLSSPYSLDEATYHHSLTGKWTFAELGNTKFMDAARIDELNQVWAGTYINLLADGSYKASIIKEEEEGSWRMVEEGKSFWLAKQEGEITAYKITALGESSMVVKVNAVELRMTRSIPTVEESKLADTAKHQLVQVTKEQLCKKWKVIGTNSTKNNTVNDELKESLLKGSILHINQDLTYKHTLLLIDCEGTGKLLNNNTGIALKSGNTRHLWNFISITDKMLKITKGHSAQVLVLGIDPDE